MKLVPHLSLLVLTAVSGLGACSTGPALSTPSSSEAVNAATATDMQGSLHFGGTLPTPVQRSYAGSFTGNHPPSYTVSVGTGTPYFGDDWALTVTVEDGTTRFGENVGCFDFITGALYAGSPKDPSPRTILAAPAATDLTAQLTYRNTIEFSLLAALSDLVQGHSTALGAPGPAQAPVPEYKVYLDYINSVRAQVNGPAFPPDGKTLPVSLFNGGRLPIPSSGSYSYTYPAPATGSFTLDISNSSTYSYNFWAIGFHELQAPGKEITASIELESGEFTESLNPGTGGAGTNPTFYDGYPPYGTQDTGFYYGAVAALQRRVDLLVAAASGRPEANELQAYSAYLGELMKKYPATSQTPSPIP